jgi:hypothetical protein
MMMTCIGSEIDSKEGIIFEWGRIPQSGVCNSSPSCSQFEIIGRFGNGGGGGGDGDNQFDRIGGSFCHRALLSCLFYLFIYLLIYLFLFLFLFYFYFLYILFYFILFNFFLFFFFNKL